jgi:hypothetical protein
MVTQTMDANQRLEAHAILDRLVADRATFCRADARRLIELIPATRGPRFSFQGKITGRGPTLKGRAAGIGDVKLEGEEQEKNLELNTPTSYRIGGYVVTHTRGQITIELMWSDTKIDQTGQSCLLTYDTNTGEPDAMLLSKQATLNLLFMSFAYVSYVPWKSVAASQS